ncbi:MAG: hypothetical protein AB1630_10845 [bacterium]
MKRLILCISLPCFTQSTLTLGTKDIIYNKGFNKGIKTRLILKRENLGEIIETGFRVEKDGMSFKISHINKDNLLKNSILLKIDRKNERRVFKKARYITEEGIGIAYLKSLFIPDWNSYSKEPTTAYIFTLNRKLESALNSIKWNIGTKGILSIPSPKLWDEEHLGYVVGMMSFLRGYFGFDVERGVINGGINGFMQTSSYAPITPLQNYEAMVGLKRKGIEVSSYFPLKTQLYSQDAFDQGKRSILSLSLNNWSLEGLFGYEQNQYGVQFERQFSKFSLSLFWANSKNNKETYGIQVTLGGKNPEILKDVIQDRKISIPTTSSGPSQRGEWSNPPANLSSLGFEETISLLDSPDKVAWYTDNYFRYLDDHNDDLFKIYLPSRVFELKGGNCTEQMGFEAYALREHGYEAYTCGIIATSLTHAICVYKDKTTGKWNLIDYGTIREVQSENLEELLDKYNPGWFSFSLKDPSSSKTLGQRDSPSKKYLIDWFEE